MREQTVQIRRESTRNQESPDRSARDNGESREHRLVRQCEIAGGIRRVQTDLSFSVIPAIISVGKEKREREMRDETEWRSPC